MHNLCFIQNEAFYNIIDTHYSWCPKWGYESLLQLVNIHKVFCIFIWPVTSSYWPGCKLLIFIRLFCIMLYPKWGFLEHSWHLLFMMSKMRLWVTSQIFTQCKHIFLFIFFTMETQFSYTMETKYFHNANNLTVTVYYENLQSVLQGCLPILKFLHGI